MAIREVRKIGDPILRKVSKPVKNFDEKLHILLDDMHDTLAKYEGIGLAAPQVGVLRRVVVVAGVAGERLVVAHGHEGVGER